MALTPDELSLLASLVAAVKLLFKAGGGQGNPEAQAIQEAMEAQLAIVAGEE